MAKEPRFDDGFSELMPAPPSHGIGHNNPPDMLPIGKELESNLKKAHKAAIKRAQDLIDTPAIAKVESEAHLKKATERVRQYQASLTELDGQRKAEKEPYRLGGAQVDGFFNEPSEDLALLKIALEKKMNAHNDAVKLKARQEAAAELRRKEAAAEIARQVAAKKQADAAKAAEKAKGAKTIAKAVEKKIEADAAIDAHDEARVEVTRAERTLAKPAADWTRSRSSNAVSSQQEFVDFRDLDRAKIQLEALREHFAIDDIAKAVRAYVKANNDAVKEDLKNRRQPIAGVNFFINSSTRVGGG